MTICEKEGNDQGFLCCFGSYVGVIVAGILQAIAFVLSIVNLFTVEPIEDGESPVGLIFALCCITITLIGTTSFIVNLIWRESTNSRMCLFVTQLLLYVAMIGAGIFVEAWLIMTIVDSQTGGHGASVVKGLGILLAWLFAAIFVIYAVIGALFLRVFKSYLDNLRNRRKSVVINDN